MRQEQQQQCGELQFGIMQSAQEMQLQLPDSDWPWLTDVPAANELELCSSEQLQELPWL